jgi:hypothetical protein
MSLTLILRGHFASKLHGVVGMAQLVVGNGAEALRPRAVTLADLRLGHLQYLVVSRFTGDDTAVRCVGGRRGAAGPEGGRRPPAGPALSS